MIKEKQVMIELTNDQSEKLRAVIIEQKEQTTLMAVDIGNIDFDIVELNNESFKIVSEV